MLGISTVTCYLISGVCVSCYVSPATAWFLFPLVFLCHTSLCILRLSFRFCVCCVSRFVFAYVSVHCWSAGGRRRVTVAELFMPRSEKEQRASKDLWKALIMAEAGAVQATRTEPACCVALAVPACTSA